MSFGNNSANKSPVIFFRKLSRLTFTYNFITKFLIKIREKCVCNPTLFSFVEIIGNTIGNNCTKNKWIANIFQEVRSHSIYLLTVLLQNFR